MPTTTNNNNKRKQDDAEPDVILFATSRDLKNKYRMDGDIKQVLSTHLTKDARDSFVEDRKERTENLFFGEARNDSRKKTAAESENWKCHILNKNQTVGSPTSDTVRDAYEQLVDRARREDKPILLFVHGYNNTAVDPLQTAALMRSKYDCEVIAFIWPTEGTQGQGLWDYGEDLRDAILTARPFLRFIQKTGDYLRELGNRQPVSLLCHSMGCYVLQRVLQETRVDDNVPDLQKGWQYLCGDTRSQPSLFTNIIITAADVDSQGHVAWVKKLKPRGKVFVFINTGDDVLRLSNWFAGRVLLAKSLPEMLMFRGPDHPIRLGQTLDHIEPSTRRVYVNVNVTKKNRLDWFQFLQLEHWYHKNGQGEIADFYRLVIHGHSSERSYRSYTRDTGRRYYMVSGYSEGHI